MSLTKSNPLKSNNDVHIVIENDGDSIVIKFSINPFTIGSLLSLEQAKALNQELSKAIQHLDNYSKN